MGKEPCKKWKGVRDVAPVASDRNAAPLDGVFGFPVRYGSNGEVTRHSYSLLVTRHLTGFA